MYRVFKTPTGYKARLVGTLSFDQSTFFECADWQSFQRELQHRINNEYEESEKDFVKEFKQEYAKQISEIRETVTGEKSDTSQFEIPFNDRRK